MSRKRRLQLIEVSLQVSDALWERVATVLPAEPARRGRGRPRVSDRACLEGILYVARSGQPWSRVPRGMGFAHGKTCWRRFDEWTRHGIWPALLDAILADGMAGLELERVLVDATTVTAKKGARKRVAAPLIAANHPARSTC
jgi:transposase